MASLQVNRASGTILSQRFIKMVLMVAVGTVLSTLVTGWMRRNVVDIGAPGGDAIYNVVSSMAIMMLPLKKSTATYLAAGSMLGSVFTLSEELGLI